MALREIVLLGDDVLRKRARKVTSFDKKFQALVDDMVETMVAAPGVGLAAPQVGISQRVIVIRLPDDEETREEFGDEAGKVYIIANPDIVKVSKDISEGVEGCLSIPGYYGAVDRPDKVTIKGLDRHGKPMRVKADGWLARIFQHEIDHLDGQLFIDIANQVWEARPEDEESEDEDET